MRTMIPHEYQTQGIFEYHRTKGKLEGLDGTSQQWRGTGDWGWVAWLWLAPQSQGWRWISFEMISTLLWRYVFPLDIGASTADLPRRRRGYLGFQGRSLFRKRDYWWDSDYMGLRLTWAGMGIEAGACFYSGLNGSREGAWLGEMERIIMG